MHDLMFRFKRAHLKAVAFAKPLLKKWQLTPARFDVLYVVQAKSVKVGGILQSDIWRILGLHPSTISKMCIRLEELGLIERRDAETRNHEILVRLTKEGTGRLLQAMRLAFKIQPLRFAYRALLMDLTRTSVRGADDFIAKLRRKTERAARALGDDSTLLYPLHPPSRETLRKVEQRLGWLYAHLDDLEQQEAIRAERRAKHIALLDAAAAALPDPEDDPEWQDE
ncbi:MAG: MarR family transcriptional regulator [Deltaproteobacteria bacterium]|nr:MarR family transcriptional regulator [Deltaproteobacteria bacterium]